MNKDHKKLMSRYRAKKSYLMRKKGFSELDAIGAASSILQIVDTPVSMKAKNPLCNLHLKLVATPSADEVKVEVERQKRLGAFTEIPILVSSAEKPAQSAARAERRAQNADESSMVSLFFCASIVAIASWLLVNSSLEVFGTGLEGWGKAIILELGILGLAVSRTRLGSSIKEMAHFILSKGTLLFLVILSFTVLHTGVESHRSGELNTAKSTSAAVTELTRERDGWQKTYDSYAENRISDRRDAMKEISRLNESIKTERGAISQSLDGTVINLKSNTEMMIRAALLLLNIIFGHKLAGILATMKWPPLREERLVS